MIVCHCHGLTDRQIRAAAARCGARSKLDLGPDCPAASGCGACTRAVDEILQRATSTDRGAPHAPDHRASGRA